MNYKKGISLILSIIMVLGTFTMSAYALDEPAAGADVPEVAQDEQAINANAGEEPEAVEDEAEPVKAEATDVKNVEFSDATETSVKVKAVASGLDMEAIKFGKEGETVAVSDNLATAVEVTGLKANTVYAVYAVKEGAEDQILGYYVNAMFVVNKGDDVLVPTWDCGSIEGLEVAAELTKNGSALAVEGSSYTDTDVVAEQTYAYALTIKVTDGEAIYEAYSASKSATMPAKSAAVTNLKGTGYKATQYAGTGDSKVISADAVRLTWSAVASATSYDVYKMDTADNKWVKVANTTAATYDVAGLTNGHSYKFKLKSVAENEHGKSTTDSNIVGPFNITYQTAAPHAIWYKGVITAKAKAFKTKSTNNVSTSLKKGTKVTVLQRAGGRSQVMLSNGKIYWVNRTKCHYTKQIYNSKKDWSTKAKENFVKYKSSKTKYLIWISQYTQRVNVFQGSKGNWKLIKTGLCATGRITRKTPMGTFKTSKKEKGWFYKKYKNAPVVHFAARNSFHSRPTSYSGKVITKTIGKPASKGCCRLEQPYIDWIYKYIPKKTTVISW